MQDIPKIIHYVWVGGKPIPKRFKKNIDSWERHNSEFQIMLWNESNIDFSHDFMKLALQQKKWALISDFVRVAVVKQYGGIYLDTDVFVLKSFQPLLSCNCFMGFQEDSYVNGAVLGAVPNHWLISRLYQYYIDLEPLEEDADIDILGNGPKVINRLLEEEGVLVSSDEIVESRDVTLFPKRYFYPYNWNEDFTDSCITPDTIAIHFWDFSWHLYGRSSFRIQIAELLKTNRRIYDNAKRLYRYLSSFIKTKKE
jgi:Glycosyltransferase sugar-binding region containing DXD motif